MTRQSATKSSVVASTVLTLAMMGDSLLYAVLPLNAAEFGVTLAGVGVLLSVNRLVRLLLFSRFAAASRRWGLRHVTIAAAILGGLSTIAVALSSGMPALLGARVVWGVAFGLLALTTLGYATSSVEGAGARVGLSLSIREAGPLFAYTAGVAIVAALGARGALGVLGFASLLAVPLAFMLPAGATAEKRESEPLRGGATPRVARREIIACALGFVVDGVFVTTIGLLFAASHGVAGAAAFAALALAGKRLAVLVLAPFAGRVGDRFGATRTLVVSLWIAAAGAGLLVTGVMSAGVAALTGAAAVASTVLPLTGPDDARRGKLHDLARLNAARDLGAAVGPMVGIALFTGLGGSMLYATSATVIAVMAVLAQFERDKSGESEESGVVGYS